jgi:RimJ/RimL family protein N-acetyltransferase
MIRGTRVNLVPVALAHKERTRAWTNDPEIARLMDRPRPVSADEHDAYFDSIVVPDERTFFAVELVDTGTHVGNVWFRDIDTRHRKAELSVVIGDAAARGKGAGSEAIHLLCRHGFERLNLHRIYAYVLAINPAAKRAFEAAGFTQEGVLRDDRWTGDGFVDAYLLARLAGD